MKSLLLAVSVFLFFAANVVHAQTEEKRIERLSGLAKIWGAVKYFHPHPATRELDWDKALVDAIPKVNAAKSPEEYAAAINSMLAALGDQDTAAGVENAAASKPAAPAPDGQKSPTRLEDGVLIYDVLAASRVTHQEWRRLDDFVAEAGKLFPQAKAVVFDARGLDETNEDVLGEFDFQVRAILPRMLDRDITLGTVRYRMHNGYASQSGMTSGGFYSSLVTDAPEPFRGSASKTTPIIFLIDEKTELAPVLSGLQAAGAAFVVADGASPSGGDFYALRLSENVRVRLRKTEAVNPDGSTGFAPDLLVPKGDAEKTWRRLIAENKFVSARPKSSAVEIAQVSQKDRTYAEMEFPDREHRLLALFRFWNVINYFFPYKDLIGADWNLVLPKYIPQFEANKDALAYRVTAQRMVAEIKDSHGSLQAPPLKNQPVIYFPPFVKDYAENQLFVKAVLDEESGFRAGDVILEADGAPIENLIGEYAARTAASTPQALMRNVKTNGIFRGAKDSRARLKVRGLGGATREIETIRSIVFSDPRQAKYRFAARETPIVSILQPGGFGYVDLDRLPVSDEEIDRMFETVKSAPAVIFDMRGYPRGRITPIVRRLTDKPIPPGVFSRPILAAKNLGSTSFVGSPTFGFLVSNETRERARGEIYRGRIVMLINESAQSAAEGAASVFAAARPDLTFVGTPTAGANGDVTYGVLPGNLRFSFSGHHVRREDGSQLQRVGIQPHVRVAPTIRGIVEGRDEILEAAVKFLQENKR